MDHNLQSCFTINRYGRSPRQELLDDIRGELLRAKKANAQLVLSNRILNTKLQRLTRETEKRNRPSRLSSDSKDVNLQDKVASRSPSLHNRRTQAARNGSAVRPEARKEPPQRERTRVGQESLEDNGTAKVPDGDSPAGDTREQIRELSEKNKKRLRVAKAYAEQNKKLKDRLKQMREQVVALRNSTQQYPGSTSADLQAHGLENWDISELVELVKKLDDTRNETPLQRRENSASTSSGIEDQSGHRNKELARLHDAELKVAHLRGENDKLKRDLEYYKAKIQSFTSKSTSDHAQKRPFLETAPKAVERVRIPPLQISHSSDNSSSDQEKQQFEAWNTDQHGNSQRYDDHIPSSVLLHVISELSLVHNERQLVLKRISSL